MISLYVFWMLAVPYCVGTIDERQCEFFVANEAMLEQVLRPGEDAEFYMECAVERIPPKWWARYAENM